MLEEINYVTIVKTFSAFYNLVRIFLSRVFGVRM